MKSKDRWLWFGGALAAGGVALALGVPLGTVLIVAALLACPVTMYFGMRGMHRASGGMAYHPKSPEGRPTEQGPREPGAGQPGTKEPARRG